MHCVTDGLVLKYVRPQSGSWFHAWDLCASSPKITMKACARVVVIEVDCHVLPQRQLGSLTAIGPLPFFKTLPHWLHLFTHVIVLHMYVFFKIRRKPKANVTQYKNYEQHHSC